MIKSAYKTSHYWAVKVVSIGLIAWVFSVDNTEGIVLSSNESYHLDNWAGSQLNAPHNSTIRIDLGAEWLLNST